jgi:hypothetical protein
MRSAALPAVLIAAAAALAAATLAAEASRRADRAAVVAELERAPLPPARRERLASWAAQQDDPVRIRVEIARYLVNLVLAPVPEGEEMPQPGSLGLAHRLAAEAYSRRPAAWRAPALMGAALYLGRSLAGDRRLVTEGSAWDRPLAVARGLAPAAVEPVRFQAIAYLEIWPSLPPEKRQEARGLLRRVLRDPATFGRLIGPWLAIAEEAGEPLDEALAVVPDQPAAWRHLQRTFAERGDWRSFAAARERWRRALALGLERRLEEAARRQRRGDALGARGEYLRVITDAPMERRFAPLVERALLEAPAGAALPSLAPPLERWLEWVLALDLVGANPLSDTGVDRLAGLVAGLPDATAAHAAVAAGRLADAERIERRSPDAARAEPWAGYRVAKARELTERGQGREALAVLDRLPAAWSGRPSGVAARRDAARAAGDAAAALAAERRLDELAGDGAVWSGAGGTAGFWRELVTGEPADGVEVHGAAGRGALVEVKLDGRLVAAERARGLPIRAEEPLEAGLHLVEVAAAAGTFSPAAVRPLPR